MLFLELELISKFQNPAKALSTIKQIELINKKKFVKAALGENFKTFVINIVILESLFVEMSIYPNSKTQIAFLLTKKVPILDKYYDFAYVSFKKKALVFSEQTNFNKHVIKLEKDKQPHYRLFYSLELVELKTLKIYIETYLNTGFIWPSKFLTRALILLNKKLKRAFICIQTIEV